MLSYGRQRGAPGGLALEPQEYTVTHYNNLVWQVVGLLMLFCILLDALVCEIRQRQVPLIHVGLLLVVGLLWHGVEMAQPGEGFFSAHMGPAGTVFSGLGAITAFVICLPLVPLKVLRLPHALLAAGVGAFAGFQAVLDVVLFGAIAFVVLYTVSTTTGPSYQVFLRRLARVLEFFVPGASAGRGAATQAPVMPTSLVMTSALGLYGLWIAAGLAPIVRF